MYGKTIARLRKEHGLTQKGLADAIGMAYSTVSQYEQEIREPNLATLKRLADFFGVELSVLITGKNPADYEPMVNLYLSLSTANQAKAIDYMQMLKVVEDVSHGR